MRALVLVRSSAGQHFILALVALTGGAVHSQSERLPFFDHLGLIIHEVSDSRIVVRLNIRPDLLGPYGSLQGGIVSTLVDVAGASMCAQMTGTPLVATADITVQFLAPGKVGPIDAIATPLRQRRSGAVAEVRVEDVGREHRLIAAGFVAVSILEDRRETS
jgi:uncharacterized protein (TIGR00369 family)